jgi:hypothetical protein
MAPLQLHHAMVNNSPPPILRLNKYILESVTYVIDENIHPISERQLKQMKFAIFRGKESSRQGRTPSNFRMTQPRNNREIFYYTNKQNEMAKLFEQIMSMSAEDKCNLNKVRKSRIPLEAFFLSFYK